MTNEQYYDLIRPYEDAMNLMKTRLEILNHNIYDRKPVLRNLRLRERIFQENAH